MVEKKLVFGKYRKLQKIRLKRLELALLKSKGNTRRDILRSIWKIKNPEKNRAHKNKYYLLNREKIVRKSVEYNKEYRRTNPETYHAHNKVTRVKAKGLCKICKKSKATQKHHEDYSKPYDIIFVCNPCHAMLDKMRRLKW